MLALFAALGFPSGREIVPVIDLHDKAFGNYDAIASLADIHAGGLIRAAEQGYVLGPEHDQPPKELDYLQFSDLVWGSVYGGGLSRDELIAEYERLTSRWPDQRSGRES